MPELPEVETIRRSLVEPLVGRQIVALERLRPEVLALTITPRCPLTIERLRRRGKYLLLDLRAADGTPCLLVAHFRMTGRWTLHDATERRDKHLHVRLTLDNGLVIDHIDPRRFGRLALYPGHDETIDRAIAALGPEPLGPSFGPDVLERACMRHNRTTIKALLLNQTVVAGLGNIYTDEALFRARVRPTRMTNRIGRETLMRLCQSVTDVLEQGVGLGGTTFRDYVDGLGRHGHFQLALAVYGRAQKPCLVCHTTLRRAIVAGRSTVYCPRCQR